MPEQSNERAIQYSNSHSGTIRRVGENSYGSFLTSSLPEQVSTSIVKSSWQSSFKRAANFTSHRDRVTDGDEFSLLDEDFEAYYDDGYPAGYNAGATTAVDDFNYSPSNSASSTCDLEDEEQGLLPKPIVLIPKSTFAQSWFNSVNILMGIGILSLPYAFSLTGFAVGLTLFILFALATWHTARLLQHCLDHTVDGLKSNTYGDLGELAFGMKGRTFISIIFFLELLAANVALVILSADSIKALFPETNLIWLKIILVALILPVTIPKSLSIASYGSLVGILTLMNLTGILIFDGLTYTGTPGSLLNPADYSILPVEWYPVPLSFGLLMSGFAGHSVFPSIYRDMRAPERYPSLLNWTYSVIIFLYALIASIGYAMFGSTVLAEITQNLPLITGYNQFLTKATVSLIAINPITKFPLNISPITSQLELMIHPRFPTLSPRIHRLLTCTISSVTVLIIAVLYPGFHSVMALLGSFFSFTVSVCFPVAVYLKFFWNEMSKAEKTFEILVCIFGMAFGSIGTIWVFIS